MQANPPWRIGMLFGLVLWCTDSQYPVSFPPELFLCKGNIKVYDVNAVK